MISLRSSPSTSFMLAALRVLHVDTSHAHADAASIEGEPLTVYQLAPVTKPGDLRSGLAAYGVS